jgi:Ca2+-transporting ATPase
MPKKNDYKETDKKVEHLDEEYYNKTISDVLAKLSTSESGLSSKEVTERIRHYGKNELESGIQVPKWLMFLSQFRDVLVIVLLIAGIISFLIGNFQDSAIMLVIVLINAIVGFIQQYKAEKIIEKLKDMIKSPARVIRDEKIAEISQSELVPGDIIEIEEGDKLPADIRLIESFNLRTNDFSLTGESMPNEKHSNVIKEKVTLADRDNMAYLGTTVASGDAKGIVVATGMNTEMGKIANMTQRTVEVKSPLQKELGILANKLTIVVILICIIIFVVALTQGFSIYISLIIALGIAVAAVPQALPAQVTVALSTGSQRLAERKAVVKNLPSVETLGSTNVICTDKTGTLTKNEMTVQAVWFNGKNYRITGIGYEPKGTILDENNKPLSQKQINEIEIMMDASTMASNAEIHPPDDTHNSWYPVGDPTEAALITLSTKLGTRSPIEDQENPELYEFPFDSERKRMSSVRQFGERKVLTMKGATSSILTISKFILKNHKVVPITDNDKNIIENMNVKFSKRAMRVLAIAYRPLEIDGSDYLLDEIEKDVIFLGLMAMIDPPKEGVKEAINSAHEAQIKIFIMTGDHAITAQAVGREIGLSETKKPSPVIMGNELHDMPDSILTEKMNENKSLIFSRVDPADKLRIVENLEEQGLIVAVTGDGVNDAPALKKAHIGVAMGLKGTDVAKEASELVLLDDSFPTLVVAIKEGRTIYDNLKKTVLASLTSNGAELAIVLMGLASVALWNWAMPILIIQILAIDLLSEIMPLTFLTFDPSSKDMMRSPPRSKDEHILDKFNSTEVILFGLFMGLLSFINFALFMNREGIEFTVDNTNTILYARATTITYITIAFCQYVNIMSRRYEYVSIFNRNFWTNKILLISIAVSIALVLFVIYVPFFNSALGFAPLMYTDWLYVFFSVSLFLAAFEILKLGKRWKKKNEIRS